MSGALAEVQRAFIHAKFPDKSTFTPLSVGTAHGTRAMQTNLMEQCLFAARRAPLDPPRVLHGPHRQGVYRGDVR